MLKHKQPHQHPHSGPRGPWTEHLCEDCGMTLENALQLLAAYEFIPYIDPVRGHVATIIKRNKEIHFAAYRKYRTKVMMTHKRIAEFLQPLLDTNTFLVTKVAKDDDATFIERLGFQRLGATIDGTTTYILNKITYPGAKRCDRSVH